MGTKGKKKLESTTNWNTEEDESLLTYRPMVIFLVTLRLFLGL